MEKKKLRKVVRGPQAPRGPLTAPPATVAAGRGSSHPARSRHAAQETTEDSAFSGSILALLAGVLIWGYWDPLAKIAGYWCGPHYAMGWLVPVFAAVLLWVRWQPVTVPTGTERRWGLALLAAGLGCRLWCAQVGLDVAEMVTFVPCLASLFLLVGGWRMFRWAAAPVGLLIFMYPLPWSWENRLLDPLQDVATTISTFALQTLGFEAYHQGNVIFINEMPQGVVDASSRLPLAMTVLAAAAAITLITRRPWWERVLILLSAIPIALAVNVGRIATAGIFFGRGGTAAAGMVLHELAGWIMMPLAILLLWIEFLVVSHLLRDVEGKPAAARGYSVEGNR